MLERMWRKGNPIALLVGIWIGTATMENSMETPYQVRSKTTVWPSQGFLGGATDKDPVCQCRWLSLAQDKPPEKGMAVHSSILAWENPTDRGV